jgi:hypothetical protein
MAVDAVLSELLSTINSLYQGIIQGIFFYFWLDAPGENPSTTLNSWHLLQLDLDQALHRTGIYHRRIRELHFPCSLARKTD